MTKTERGLVDVGLLDMSTLSPTEADELNEMYVQSQNYHQMVGPLEKQNHTDVLEWIMKKPAQVRIKHKHAVVIIVSKLASVYANRV